MLTFDPSVGVLAETPRCLKAHQQGLPKRRVPFLFFVINRFLKFLRAEATLYNNKCRGTFPSAESPTITVSLHQAVTSALRLVCFTHHLDPLKLEGLGLDDLGRYLKHSGNRNESTVTFEPGPP